MAEQRPLSASKLQQACESQSVCDALAGVGMKVLMWLIRAQGD